MALSDFTVQRVVEFVDTDMGGIVHFSRYPVFVETAEHRFRETAGHPVHDVVDGTPIGWPRVAVFDGGWFEWSNDESNPIETGVPGK